jgi:hypothetical protein
MRLAGVDARLHVWEGLWHVFEWYPDIPEAELSLDEIAAFLRRHLMGDQLMGDQIMGDQIMGDQPRHRRRPSG